MAAAAEAARAAVLVRGENVGLGVDQPLGGRRGRRAEHDAKTGAAEHVERTVEPGEIEAVGFGLDA